MELWKMLIIFLAYIIINGLLIFFLLYKQGKFVEKGVSFVAVQIYPILVSILLLMYRTNGYLMGYLIGILFIITSIISIVIKKTDSFLSRLLSVFTIILVNISFWYNEYHVALFGISLIAVIGLLAGRNYYNKNMWYNSFK